MQSTNDVSDKVTNQSLLKLSRKDYSVDIHFTYRQ